jgi:hydrogenase expression/formation protein HypD
MKYLDEFRDGTLARQLGERIGAEVQPGRRYSFMEFCGGHTHTISRYGVPDLLPPSVRLVHGPGCPVCVLPMGHIDSAIHLALHHGATVCTYGDTLRVPASGQMSLMKAKARGGDIRWVYSVAEALALARAEPQREVVFFAIGFETTTPPTALAIRDAAREGLRNFSVLCCHVLTPAAMAHMFEAPAAQGLDRAPLDGLIGPAHVSVVIGTAPYERLAAQHRMPVVVAGFEPLDVLQAILMLVRQVNQGRAQVDNQFTRAVTRHGNPKAQALMHEVFEPRPSFEWRGLGHVPRSALAIRPAWARWDAERRFGLHPVPVADHKACECGAVLRGVKQPSDCSIFGTVCTPDNPVGACMVSSEGACAAHYRYGRFRQQPLASAATTEAPAP